MKRRPSNGFALMAVLWCLGIMMVAVLGMVTYVSTQLDEDTAREKDAAARDLALSGLAMGRHPRIDPGDPLLAGKAPEGGYAVTLESESARLNLNWFLAGARTEALERLWISWGLEPERAQALDDCLRDWVEPGDLKRLNGAKRAEYARRGHPELPPGRPLKSLDELPQVLGFDEVEKRHPAWREAFTLWSDGRLDLDRAPADLIAAVCGTGLDRARAFVARRDPDGKPGSPDGEHWPTAEGACSALGLDEEETKALAPLLSVESPVWRIRSVGTAGNHRHTIEVVATRAAADGGVFLWREF